MDKEILEILKQIQSTQQEHTQILRASEERMQVTQAAVENLKYDLAETKGTVREIDKSIKSIKNTQGILEDVTAHNWNEIRNMKKQA